LPEWVFLYLKEVGKFLWRYNAPFDLEGGGARSATGEEIAERQNIITSPHTKNNTQPSSVKRM